jgi:tyrosinase
MITETNISPSPHAGGHLGVGGVMSNMDSSVGDPSFFLHHGFIDRNWWTWQNIDPANYTYQISGYTTQTPLPSSGYEEVTLDYVLSSLGVLPDVTVYDVMDTEGGYLCYEYDY